MTSSIYSGQTFPNNTNGAMGRFEQIYIVRTGDWASIQMGWNNKND